MMRLLTFDHKWPIKIQFQSFSLETMKSALLASKQFMFLFTLSHVLVHEVFYTKGTVPCKGQTIARPAILHNTQGLYICSSDQKTTFLFLSHDFSTFYHNSKLVLPEKKEKKISLRVFEYRGFLPYATFGTWKKFALAKNRISKIFILCTH